MRCVCLDGGGSGVGGKRRKVERMMRTAKATVGSEEGYREQTCSSEPRT